VLLLTRAVQAAHEQGVLHRDLKPANILIAPPASESALNSAFGCPRIADFGLAQLLVGAPDENDGPICGTPPLHGSRAGRGA
jgi:serine/threonine protein kinase